MIKHGSISYIVELSKHDSEDSTRSGARAAGIFEALQEGGLGDKLLRHSHDLRKLEQRQLELKGMVDRVGEETEAIKERGRAFHKTPAYARYTAFVGKREELLGHKARMLGELNAKIGSFAHKEELPLRKVRKDLGTERGEEAAEQRVLIDKLFQDPYQAAPLVVRESKTAASVLRWVAARESATSDPVTTPAQTGPKAEVESIIALTESVKKADKWAVNLEGVIGRFMRLPLNWQIGAPSFGDKLKAINADTDRTNLAVEGLARINEEMAKNDLLIQSKRKTVAQLQKEAQTGIIAKLEEGRRIPIGETVVYPFSDEYGHHTIEGFVRRGLEIGKWFIRNPPGAEKSSISKEAGDSATTAIYPSLVFNFRGSLVQSEGRTLVPIYGDTAASDPVGKLHSIVSRIGPIMVSRRISTEVGRAGNEEGQEIMDALRNKFVW